MTSQLTNTDPVYLFGGIPTYYKSFSLFLQGPRRYQITISSSCDCLGFKKYMFEPVAILVGKNGSRPVLSDYADAIDYRHGVIGWHRTFAFDTPADDDYTIMVMSHNDNPDKVLTDLKPFPGIDSPIRAAVTGKFHILVTESKAP